MTSHAPRAPFVGRSRRSRTGRAVAVRAVQQRRTENGAMSMSDSGRSDGRCCCAWRGLIVRDARARAERQSRACHNRGTEDACKIIVFCSMRSCSCRRRHRGPAGQALAARRRARLSRRRRTDRPFRHQPDRQHRTDQPDFRARRRADAVRDRHGAFAATAVGNAAHRVRHRQPATGGDSAAIGGIAFAFGLDWKAALIIGLGLALVIDGDRSADSRRAQRTRAARTDGSDSRSFCSRTLRRSRFSR